MPAVESAATQFDPRALRNALGAFATGVTIVTTRFGDKDVGLTANSFSSVSLNPPMVLWSLAKTSSNIEAFRQAGHFAVHILAAGPGRSLGAVREKGIDKFAGVAVERAPTPSPCSGSVRPGSNAGRPFSMRAATT